MIKKPKREKKKEKSWSDVIEKYSNKYGKDIFIKKGNLEGEREVLEYKDVFDSRE